MFFLLLAFFPTYENLTLLNQLQSQADNAAVKVFSEKKGESQTHIFGENFAPNERLIVQYEVERKSKRRNAYTEYLTTDEKGRFYKTLGLLYHHKRGGENQITVNRVNENLTLQYTWEGKK
ncbi:MAG: hypothetical protein SNF33_03590 [Candidatus Algichlamydia australiensis]|nr:hypothetical protein [Chlamydiales bacterium]